VVLDAVVSEVSCESSVRGGVGAGHHPRPVRRAQHRAELEWRVRHGQGNDHRLGGAGNTTFSASHAYGGKIGRSTVSWVQFRNPAKFSDGSFHATFWIHMCATPIRAGASSPRPNRDSTPATLEATTVIATPFVA
jgi:hypothetical protein